MCGVVGSVIEPPAHFFRSPIAMSHTRFAEDVKRQAVNLVLHSQLAATVVAKQTGCSVNSIHAWIKKYRSDNLVTESPPAFVSVILDDPPPTSVEIVTPNGYIVRFTTPSLDELLAAIAAC